MNICILGTEKKTDTEVELINLAQKIFDSVFYLPIEGVRIVECDGDFAVQYRKEVLGHFDIILPWLPKSKYDLANVVLPLLTQKTYCPFSNKNLFLASNRFLFLRHLISQGYDKRKIYLADAKSSSIEYIESMGFPVVLSSVGTVKKRMVAYSTSELKGMVDMVKSSDGSVLVEEYPGEKDSYCFVVGRNIYLTNLKYKLDIPSPELSSELLDIASNLKFPFAMFNLTKKGLVDDVKLKFYLSKAPEKIRSRILKTLLETLKDEATLYHTNKVAFSISQTIRRLFNR